MAFTTSDTFTFYARISLYDSHPGSCVQGQETRMVIISIMFLDIGEHPTPEIGTQAHGLGNTQRDMGIE